MRIIGPTVNVGGLLGEMIRATVPCPLAIRAMGYANMVAGEHELRILNRLCREEMISVDVGANFGVYSYWLTRFSLQCIAFEPHPECIAFMRKALTTVVAHEIAVSDVCGYGSLSISSNVRGAGNQAGRIIDDGDIHQEDRGALRVRTATIDSFELSNVGFMKIDTEGHELRVLKGASQTLVHWNPRILVECEERHRIGALESVLEFLDSLGYTGLYIGPDGRYSVIKSVEQAKDRSTSQNFLFIHRSDPMLQTARILKLQLNFGCWLKQNSLTTG